MAVVCGMIGGVAQTSLMRTLPGANGALAITDNVSGNAGFYFGNGFVSVGGSIGHIASQGSTPALSSCGTSPTLDTGSTDFAGSYTTGSAATTCTITFGTAYAAAPSCSVDANGNATQPTFTVSQTAITVTVDIASTKYSYICVGKTGG